MPRRSAPATIRLVSHRDRSPQRPGRDRSAAAPPPPPAPRGVNTAGDRVPAAAPVDGGSLLESLRDRVEEVGPAAIALVPVRFFFGATFLYAGIDKLIDPAFLDASNPASITAQLHAFTRLSPLAPVISIFEPLAIPIGILIALAEIAIGLGALSGLLFRLAAAGGAALSFLLWLTASWSTTPYYLGADLPYAAGWVALAIGGTGGLLVPSVIRHLGEVDDEAMLRRSDHRRGYSRGGTPAFDPQAAATRRAMVQVGALALASFAAASLAVPLRAFRGDAPVGGADGGDGSGNGTGSGDGNGVGVGNGGDPTPAGSGGDGAQPAQHADGSPAAGGIVAGSATIASVQSEGAVRVRLPAPMKGFDAGTTAFIVKLTGGGYTAYDAICTHEGCRVGWDSQDSVLLCPCHGAAFDPNDHGAVLGGPTRRPLTELPVSIDEATGTISLKA
jgi:thiosulfate dehydrogenase (quinone) large subunit